MKTYRVAVTGGRDHEITEDEAVNFLYILNSKLDELVADNLAAANDPYGELVVIHGNCRGVDQRAAEIAEEGDYPTVPFEAPWDELMARLSSYVSLATANQASRIAGPLRNWIMIQAADLLVAFPGGKGTANCIRQAEKKGIKVVRVGELG